VQAPGSAGCLSEPRAAYCGATMFRGLFSVAPAQTQSSEGECEDMRAEGRGTQSNEIFGLTPVNIGAGS
jgi:hypothetical protein